MGDEARRSPRVVVLDHTAELGGAELALVRLLDAIRRVEEARPLAEVHVVLFQDGPLVNRLREGGHRVDIVPLRSSIAGLGRSAAGTRSGALAAFRALPFVARLTRRVRSLEPDVIHTTSLKSDLIGLLVARLLRVSLVWHVHDRLTDDYLPARVAGLMRGLARRFPDAVIANSHATARSIAPSWPDIGGKRVEHPRITVSHPGLAPDQVRSAPREVPAGPPVIGVVGRISPTKDQLTFVRAAAIVAGERPEVSFRIIGDALFGQEDYIDLVRSEVNALGLDDQVHLTGFVDDIVGQLDALSVFVHTSAVPEPFGQVVTEAMARGVPVVATRGGGVDEIFEPGPDGRPLGWLVPPREPELLAAAISEALADPEEAAARGAAGWRAVRARFAAERTAVAVARTWDEVSARRRQGLALRGRPPGRG